MVLTGRSERGKELDCQDISTNRRALGDRIRSKPPGHCHQLSRLTTQVDGVVVGDSQG